MSPRPETGMSAYEQDVWLKLTQLEHIGKALRWGSCYPIIRTIAQLQRIRGFHGSINNGHFVEFDIRPRRGRA